MFSECSTSHYHHPLDDGVSTFSFFSLTGVRFANLHCNAAFFLATSKEVSVLNCDKAYKSRNGLEYHEDRCRDFQVRTQSATSPSLTTIASLFKEWTIRCICDINEEEGEMVQCDGCGSWLHTKCLCISNTELNESLYYCPWCEHALSAITVLTPTPPQPPPTTW
jgi:PHD-finger